MTEYFRGQAKNFSGNINNGSDIVPSILRGKIDDFTIIDEFKYYQKCANELKDVLSAIITNDDEITLKTLAIFQHYGIKTRLIDITKDENIASYFACNNYFDDIGYVYTIYDKSIKEVKDDKSLSVKRKMQTIINSEYLIDNKINVLEYFKEKANQKTIIHKSSITNPVILDYENIFKNGINEELKANLRISSQMGSFILLGNELNENNELTGKIDREIFFKLDDPKEILAKDKLTTLYTLATNHKINYVRLFPDSDLGIELTSKYNEIFTLNRFESLKDYTKLKFSYRILNEKFLEFKEFVDYMINNLEILKEEFKNQDYFYFVYKELVDYYNYYLNKKQISILSNDVVIVSSEIKNMYEIISTKAA